jgi:hypothetical protein
VPQHHILTDVFAGPHAFTLKQRSCGLRITGTLLAGSLPLTRPDCRPCHDRRPYGSINQLLDSHLANCLHTGGLLLDALLHSGSRRETLDTPAVAARRRQSPGRRRGLLLLLLLLPRRRGFLLRRRGVLL